LQENLDKINSSYPNTKFIKDYNIIIKDKSIDLVAIATPISTHFLLAKKALKANKHVFLEKPMTSNSQEAEELINLSKKQKQILMVGYTFVYSEPIKKIKRIIDSKQLGKIYYYDSTRINLGLLQKDINVIWDLACHDLSIINYLFKGSPLYVQAFGSKFLNNKNEEIANLIVGYKNNITAHINVSWLSPVKIRSILIGGSKKTIVFDDIPPSEKIKIYDKNIKFNFSKVTPFTPAYRSGNIIIPYINQTESLLNELNHLVYCIKNNKTPITNGDFGLQILKVLETSDLSLKTKKTIQI